MADDLEAGSPSPDSYPSPTRASRSFDKQPSGALAYIDPPERLAREAKALDLISSALRTEARRVSSHHLNPSGTIHKVPSSLRGADDAAYTPKLVSIGPYHFQKEDATPIESKEDAKKIKGGLRVFEDVKLKYLLDLILREPVGSPPYMETYVGVVNELSDKAMEQYSEKNEAGNPEFVKMMMLDGCFILEFLIKLFLNENDRQMNAVMSKLPTLRNDLLLVENQIPFFVLEELFKTSQIRGLYDVSFIELALFFFIGDKDEAHFTAKTLSNISKEEEEEEEGFHHLLHLYHTALKQPSERRFDFTLKEKVRRLISDLIQSNRFLQSKIFRFLCWPFKNFYVYMIMILGWIIKILLAPFMFIKKMLNWVVKNLSNGEPPRQLLSTEIPNACYLRDMGFKLRKKNAMEYNFMHVTHIGNKINIPVTHIHENMFGPLQNLVALEQCSSKYGRDFTAYVTLMDNLMDTEADVALLQESGIIVNKLTSNQRVADFFHDLSKDSYLDSDRHYLASLFKDVNDYCQHSYYKVQFYRWRKRFIPDYFTNPWAIPSMSAAFILLALTLLQTIYTVYPYYNPRN